ncbi:hypothetical protein [Paenibacillus aquistagni]|uniref:hypothetical protein n=1 Tax=Paenibacillus aquistagni TaxID=1852522 RepID=UPI000B503A16|nr:hypothetical protein [Paenibacillus aquistagni]
MESVRIYEIPNCKMVSSGVGMFGEKKFDHFEKWFSSQQRTAFPRDYLFWDGEWQVTGGFHWLYVYEEGMSVPEEFDIIDFKGGLYAVVTGIDQQSNSEGMKAMNAFIESHGFEIDRSRPELGNIITPPSAYVTMGYNQMDYFTPIRVKTGQ